MTGGGDIAGGDRVVAGGADGAGIMGGDKDMTGGAAAGVTTSVL